jgi:single-stranded-DNA-specific exonuclease
MSTLSEVETINTPVWRLCPRLPEQEKVLIAKLGISKIVAALLCQRGLSDPAAAQKFLSPSLDDLGLPSLLPDYRAAEQAILGARERNELIFVHGDYDVDGVTSSSILHRFLNFIGCKVYTHVPHRIKEGYGIHLDAVEEAHRLGARLFLTCDCGIAALAQVERAHELGMVVVVTDHHEIGEKMPDAEAVVNPHRKDSQYPEIHLSGAGVVFRLCEGLAGELGYPIGHYRRAYLDLACLGTIADVMPLLGENRLIAKFGLESLANTKKVGLKALMREANVGQDPARPLEAYHVSWFLGPRLNAAGRIENAAQALELLIERDEAVASRIAQQLEVLNTDRKVLTQTTVEEAIQLVLADRLNERKVIVVAGENWHPGIVGIVAGRLVDSFNRPALALSVDRITGKCKGSARSIPNFHFAEALWAFPGLLSGGGHAMAAGCSFDFEDLERVRESLNAYADERLCDEDLVPIVSVDLEIDSGDLNDKTMEELALMEPFGCENRSPIFLASGVEVNSVTPTKNPAHVQLKLTQSQDRVTGIAFNLGERFATVQPGTFLNLLFSAQMNDFRGRKNIQWQVKSIQEVRI